MLSEMSETVRIVRFVPVRNVRGVYIPRTTGRKPDSEVQP
jgi:hypothetical protein